MIGRMGIERCCCPDEICAGCIEGAPSAYDMVWTGLQIPAGPTQHRFTIGNINNRVVRVNFGFNTPPLHCFYESSPIVGSLITFLTDVNTPGAPFQHPIGTTVYMNYRVQITPTRITMRVDYDIDVPPGFDAFGSTFQSPVGHISFEATIEQPSPNKWNCTQALVSETVVFGDGFLAGFDVNSTPIDTGPGLCTLTPVP